jgi:tetratricopeptide (TPR) repeat protein
VPSAGEYPELHTLYSNRSAALLQLDEAKAALKDARRCVELAPSWPKGRFREGACLRQLGRYSESVSAFDAGQELEPGNKDWAREAERTQRLLRAEPNALAQQLVMNLLPEIMQAWLRGKEAGKGQDFILQLQVMGELELLGAPKWQLLKDRKEPPKAQIRYAFTSRKEYLANLAALTQTAPADVAIVDIADRPLKIAEVGKFFSETDGDAVHVHIDIKRAAPLSKMMAIICSMPCSKDVRRFAPAIKDPPAPKNSVEPVLQLQRKSFPKAYPRLLGFQNYPGDLNFPVVDLERDAPGLLVGA